MRRASGFGCVVGCLTVLRAVVAAFATAAPDAALSAEFQSNLPAKLIWAVEGEDVELPCDVTPPTPSDSVSMVLWFKDTAGIPLYSLDARGRDLNKAPQWAVSDELGRRTYFQMGDGHRARLKVNSVNVRDQGIFRCRVDFVNSPTRNFRVNLTLVEQPTKPVIYDAQGREVIGIAGPFLEGYALSLACQVSGGRPKPSVTWWMDGELIDGVADPPVVVGSPGKFTENRLFIRNVTKSLRGTKLECRAQAGPLSKPLVREVPLDIYLKPREVKILLNEEQIYAGRSLIARCETWGSSPAARIVWRLDGVVIREPSVSSTQRSNSTLGKLSLVVGREDDGKELTCRAENPRFPGGVLEQTRILHVAYAPVVEAHLATGYDVETLREGDDVKFVCDVQSNPPPTSIVWFHDGTLLEYNSSDTLTLKTLTLAHSGEYSCLATNIIGETRSLPVLIHMKYAPRCREGHERREVAAVRHETLLLRCEVEAVPGDTVRFSWTYNGTPGDVLPMPNTKARNKGLTSVLEYTPTAEGDFGTLACWASNSVGRQKTPCLFNVVPAKPPQPPIDCSLHNESRSLEVNCIPGSDGGLPQHFLLEVHGSRGHVGLLYTPQSDQAAAGEAPPIYQELNPKPNFQLHDLEPDFEYTVAVYAINDQGRSEPVLLENVRVATPLGRMEKTFLNDLANVAPRNDTRNTVVIVALTGAAAMTLVGIGVVIGLIICKKRARLLPPKEGPDDFTTPTYVPAQRVEPRVRYGTDRRRSQRTSLYIEESRNDPDILQQVEIDLQS